MDLREKIIKKKHKTSRTYDLIDKERSGDFTDCLENEEDEYIGNNTNKIQCKVEW